MVIFWFWLVSRLVTRWYVLSFCWHLLTIVVQVHLFEINSFPQVCLNFLRGKLSKLIFCLNYFEIWNMRAHTGHPTLIWFYWGWKENATCFMKLQLNQHTDEVKNAILGGKWHITLVRAEPEISRLSYCLANGRFCTTELVEELTTFR